MQPNLIRILHAKACGARDADAADFIGSKRRYTLPNPISNGLRRVRGGRACRPSDPKQPHSGDFASECAG
jgi:hypothetical protein